MRCRWLFPLLLVAAPVARAADDVTVEPGKDAITFKVGPSAMTYHYGDKVVKPYLFPITAPGNVPVTRAYPIEPAKPDETKDHVHHKSAWFCHGDVIPEGIELKTKTTEKTGKGVDFWSEAKDKDGKARHGRIVLTKVGEVKASGSAAWAVTHNDWVSPDGVKIMDEDRTIRVQALPEGRLITFDIVLRATVCPITFGDTKEGSFGIRVHDALRVDSKKGGVLANSAGKNVEKEIWGMPADWCDYFGTVDGKPVGVAVFDHPTNPRALWHARAYGLLAANPFGREVSGFPSQKGKTDLVKIPKGGELKLKYAIYTHAGDTAAGKVAEAYETFKK